MSLFISDESSLEALLLVVERGIDEAAGDSMENEIRRENKRVRRLLRVGISMAMVVLAIWVIWA